MTDRLTILKGDVLEKLAELPNDSVNCCVTSPPYWGLRDYQVSGQIGLEPTPDAYVAKLVEVFREVRRVLRKDGTCWVNLGSSYSGGRNGGGGSFASERPGWTVFGGKRPNQSPADVPACGTDGTRLQDSRCFGRVCPDCGGELIACSRLRHAGTARNVQPPEQCALPPSLKARGIGRSDYAASSQVASEIGAPESTTASSSLSVRGGQPLANESSECPSAPKTSFDDVQSSEHSLACTDGTSQSDRPSSSRTQDTAFVCMACGYSTRMFPRFKPKDMVPIPWMVAFALQADGWWLRQDLIWHKPNPMPESVTDRCTKSHEYIFLLSKAERYWWDKEAISEPSSWVSDVRCGQGRLTYAGKRQGKNGEGQEAFVSIDNTRNRRSVWTITTQPYNDWGETVRWLHVQSDALSGDNLHIASPDCPIHGGLFDLLATALDGGHANDLENHTSHIGIRLVSGQAIDSVLSGQLRIWSYGERSLDLILQENELTATWRNNQIHKTDPAPETMFSCRPSVQRLGYIASRLVKHGWSERHLDIFVSRIWPDEMDARLLPQMILRTVRKSQFDISPSCCCQFYHKDTKNTSHFATFPEELPKLCILAGCPPGGTVLDPFAGSGTTGKVALELGRRAILIELNPKYIELIERRCNVTPGFVL